MRDKVKKIDRELFRSTAQAAKNSARKRSNHNFHELDESYQRFLNVLTKGTYVRPHKHSSPPKPETFIVLEGKIGCVIFNEKGEILESIEMDSSGDNRGVDILSGVYHSIVCLSEEAVCFEGKLGPYDPKTDKGFAQWAPEENSAEAESYLAQLEELFL